MVKSGAKDRREDLRFALNSAASNIVPEVMLSLGLLYLLLIILHLILLPDGVRNTMALISAFSGLVLIPSGLWFKKNGFKPWMSHPVLFMGFIVALVNSLVHAWLVKDPLQTTNLMLLCFACGFIVYRPIWFVLGTFLIFAGWAVLVAGNPFSPVWAHFGFALAFSGIIASLVFWVRLNSFIKIRNFEIDLRRQNELLAQEIETRAKIEESLRENRQALMDLNNELEHRVQERTILLENANADLRKAMEHAERMTASAQSAELAKTRFLANVSHELVTPLNAILGLASEMATDCNSNCLDDGAIAQINSSAELLALHVGKMLDISKLEEGQLVIDSERLNIIGSIENTLALFNDQIKNSSAKKELKICLENSINSEAFIKGDEKRMRQILVQLIGNAIKFSDSGEVRILLKKTLDADASGSFIRIEVIDSGPGLAVEHEKRLMTAFSSGDDSLQRRSDGLGLGLALASRLVSLMGGEMGFYNNAGAGATFWLVFRLEDNGVEGSDQKKENEPMLLMGKKRILVVDDNPVNRYLAVKVLEKLGFDSSAAVSGSEAALFLGKEKFDAVFMDVQMEGMDGIETTRLIRSNNFDVLDPDIPIIALTAHDTLEDRKACSDAGMNGYITKPLRADQLLAVICREMNL